MSGVSFNDLRLSKILRKEKERLGSYDGLAKAISDASKGKGIDRRKLNRLAEGDDVSLRISELVALDAYLAPRGEGLSVRPLFEQAGILAELSQAASVVFLLGSQPRIPEQRIDMSRWDVRSTAEIIRDMHRYRASIHFDIEDVIYPKPDQITGSKKEPWEKWLGETQTSLVCVGSPRACRATEVVLCKMFEVKPFAAPVRGEKKLPFYFVWPHEEHMFESRFADDGQSIQDIDPILAEEIQQRRFGAMALRTENGVLGVRQRGTAWTDYGVVVAQRRATGQIWLVLCGLSGPATYAAARAVKLILEAIPRTEPVGQHSPIVWTIVEAAIQLGRVSGDPRDVVAQWAAPLQRLG